MTRRPFSVAFLIIRFAVYSINRRRTFAGWGLLLPGQLKNSIQEEQGILP